MISILGWVKGVTVIEWDEIEEGWFDLIEDGYLINLSMGTGWRKRPEAPDMTEELRNGR